MQFSISDYENIGSKSQYRMQDHKIGIITFKKKKENNRRRYRKAEKNGKNYKIVSSKYHSISKKATDMCFTIKYY